MGNPLDNLISNVGNAINTAFQGAKAAYSGTATKTITDSSGNRVIVPSSYNPSTGSSGFGSSTTGVSVGTVTNFNNSPSPAPIPTVYVPRPSGSGGGGYNNTVSNRTPSVNQSTPNNKQEVQTSLSTSSLRNQNLTGVNLNNNRIVVNPSGGVTYKGSTYLAGAEIPDLNMTAQQYATTVKNKALQQGIVNKNNVDTSKYTINTNSDNSGYVGDNQFFKGSDVASNQLFNDVIIPTAKLKQSLKENYLNRGYASGEANILSDVSMKKRQSFGNKEEFNILRSNESPVQAFKFSLERTGNAIKNLPDTAGISDYGYALATGGLSVLAKEKLLNLNKYGKNAYDLSPINPQIYANAGDKGLGIFVATLPYALASTPAAFIKAPPITNYGLAKMTAKDELAKLNDFEKYPLKTISSVPEKNGVVLMNAEQKTPFLTRNVAIRGNLVNTESGKAFLPTSEGLAVIYGKIKVGREKYNIAGVQRFRSGGKSAGIKVGELNGLDVFKGITSTGVEPIAQNYVVYQGARSFIKELQRSKAQFGGNPTKEFSDFSAIKFNPENSGIPTVSKEAFYTLNPKGTGFTIIRPEETPLKLSFPSTSKRTPLETTFKPQIEVPTFSVPSITGKPTQIIKSPTKSSISLKTQITVPNTNLKPMTQQDLVSLPVTKVQTNQAESSNQIKAVKTEQVISNKNNQKYKAFEVTVPSFRTETKQSQSLKQTLNQKQKSLQKQIQPPQQTFIDNIPPPTNRNPNPIIKIPLLTKVIRKMREEGSSNNFEAFGIRFGKPVKIGTGTKQQAETKLSNWLKNTLGASGFLEKGGEKILSSNLSLSEQFGFRKSKRNPYNIVQEKNKRLTKGGSDVSEISFFKKGSKSSFKI